MTGVVGSGDSGGSLTNQMLFLFLLVMVASRKVMHFPSEVIQGLGIAGFVSRKPPTQSVGGQSYRPFGLERDVSYSPCT